MSLTPLVDELRPANAIRNYAGRRRSFKVLSSQTIGLVAAVIDTVLIIASAVATAFAYHHLAHYGQPPTREYLAIGSVSALVFVSLAAARDLYKVQSLRHFSSHTRRSMLPWVIAILVCSLILFLFKSGEHYSRGSLAIFGIVGFALLVGTRYVVTRKLNAALADGSLPVPLAITIGDSESLSHLPDSQILRRWGLREGGRWALPRAENLQSDLAIVDDAIEAARVHNVQFVLLALNWSNGRRRDLVSERLQLLPVPVLLLPDKYIGSLLAQGIRQFGSDLAVEVQRAPLSPGELAIKRTLDLLLAATILVALAPLLALVSLLIKLDSPGPIIFRQRRKGFNGREFAVYKFRTMNVLEDGDEIRQAQRNDSRVTRIGRLLRASSIDELPQLANVLRGQMSLVGPRPHPVALDNGCSKLIANYAFRQHVRPGLTGWAQVNGFRGETAKLELMEERVVHDLWYIKNWSIWLDLRIIVRTCLVLLRPHNVY
jgi:undecaprenyl-phosphate galactose phosphotransferase/putative colanic acid biosynthesis UDP-glucose lipid carrier transferase